MGFFREKNLSQWTSSDVRCLTRCQFIGFVHHPEASLDTLFLEVFEPQKHTKQTPNLRRYDWKP